MKKYLTKKIFTTVMSAAGRSAALWAGVFLTLVSVSSLSAENVSPERAREIAFDFISSQPSTRGSSVRLSLVWDGTSSILSEIHHGSGLHPYGVHHEAGLHSSGTRSGAGEAPAFYVFNNEGGKGYVVIAGDDRAVPILGYSPDTNIDPADMPSNFVSWMHFIRREVNYAREADIAASPEIKAMWADDVWKSPEFRRESIGKVVVKHTTASWDQNDPFWNQCPRYRGQHTYSGCVITAVSTVMKFHGWPDRGVGRTEAYQTPSLKINVPARDLGAVYDWNNMPLKYYDGDRKVYNSSQASQVSRLMADVGAALMADYGTDGIGGTAAFSSDIPLALAQYMKYDKSIYCAERDFYPYHEWVDLVKSELDDHPVVYGGTTQYDEGHSFVLDGYTDRNYFHVNWGWSGLSDGYFLLTALDPDMQGAGGASSGFNTYQDVIVNMVPDHGGHSEEIVLMLPYDDGQNAYGGIVSSTRNIRPNSEFTLNIGAFICLGAESVECEMMVAVVDRYGEIRQELFRESFSADEKMEPNYLYSLDDLKVTVHNPIQPGDRIKVFYKTSRMDSFIPVKAGRDASSFAYELILAEDPSADRPFLPSADLEHSLRFTYDKSAHLILIDMAPGISMELRNPDGADITGNCVIDSGAAAINTAGFAPGTYTLLFRRGREAKALSFRL